MKIIITLLVLAFAAQGYAQLSCYVCNDCPTIDKKTVKAETCGGATPTPAPPTTPTQPPTAKTPEEPKPGSKAAAESTSRCFKLTTKDGEKEKIARGCTTYETSDKDTCKKANGGTDPASCSLCTKNECNSATSIIISSITLAAAIILTLRSF